MSTHRVMMIMLGALYLVTTDFVYPEFYKEIHLDQQLPDVKIIVREPSLFKIFDQHFYLPRTDLHIDCVSTSIPPADVIFERKNRENGEFEKIDRESLMTVGGTFERGFTWNMTLDEDMELRCTSTQNGKKFTATKSIMVAYEDFIVFSDIEKNDKATSLELAMGIYERDNVKLTCVLPNSAADWDVSWRYKNNDLESSRTYVFGHSKYFVLYLKDIKSNSSGKYQCVVKNGKSEEFQEIVLNVESISKPYHTDAGSPSSVTVNYDETFVLDCGMTGNPLPDVKWFKGGHPYTSGDMEGSLLKVSRARGDDNGQFECLAENRAGSTSNFIEVRVEGDPNASYSFYWYFPKLVEFVVFVCIVCIAVICFLSYKLHRNKLITKQKDIQLNMLYLMKQNDPGPIPEDMKHLPIEERVTYLPYPREFEISREHLEIREKIGSGNFGYVNKGYLSMTDPKSLIEYKTRLPVAIKSTKKSFDVELQIMLFEELKIMCAIEKHPNVISLIGAVTTNIRKGDFYLVTEYADNGDLLNYLRKGKDMFYNMVVDTEEPVTDVNYLVPKTNKKKKYLFDDQQTEPTRLFPSVDTLSTLDLLSFALQIANGMEFLAAVPCVHRDLAARNVLITSSRICRIADFGLARRYTDKNYYRITNFKQATFPVRWMTPESLETYKFNEKTDVWSYGITLFEIFTLGDLPYPKVPNEEIEENLKSGKHNKQPEYCHDDVYALMKQCWQKSPDLRPNFSMCFKFLKAHMKEFAGELFDRVTGQLHMELEEQHKLEQWLMTNRPDNPGGTFARRTNDEEETPTEQYLVVESSL